MQNKQNYRDKDTTYKFKVQRYQRPDDQPEQLYSYDARVEVPRNGKFN